MSPDAEQSQGRSAQTLHTLICGIRLPSLIQRSSLYSLRYYLREIHHLLSQLALLMISSDCHDPSGTPEDSTSAGGGGGGFILRRIESSWIGSLTTPFFLPSQVRVALPRISFTACPKQIFRTNIFDRVECHVHQQFLPGFGEIREDIRAKSMSLNHKRHRSALQVFLG